MVYDPYDRNRNEKASSLFPVKAFASLLAVMTFIVIGTKVFTLEEEQEKLRKQIEAYDEAEQYALLATVDGWYDCCNCTAEKVFLLRGEVCKYGSTIKKNRYSEAYLEKHNVRYVVQFEGDLTACRKEEIKKIRMYKFSPENVRRTKEQRLVRPPGNCINN